MFLNEVFVPALDGWEWRTYLPTALIVSGIFLALPLFKNLIESREKGVDYNWKGYKN